MQVRSVTVRSSARALCARTFAAHVCVCILRDFTFALCPAHTPRRLHTRLHTTHAHLRIVLRFPTLPHVCAFTRLFCRTRTHGFTHARICGSAFCLPRLRARTFAFYARHFTHPHTFSRFHVLLHTATTPHTARVLPFTFCRVRFAARFARARTRTARAFCRTFAYFTTTRSFAFTFTFCLYVLVAHVFARTFTGSPGSRCRVPTRSGFPFAPRTFPQFTRISHTLRVHVWFTFLHAFWFHTFTFRFTFTFTFAHVCTVRLHEFHGFGVWFVLVRLYATIQIVTQLLLPS